MWWYCSTVHKECNGVKFSTGLLIWISLVTMLPIAELSLQIYELLGHDVDLIWNRIITGKEEFHGDTEDHLFGHNTLDINAYDLKSFWSKEANRKVVGGIKVSIHAFNMFVIIVTGLMIYFYEYRWLCNITTWVKNNRGPLWVAALIFFILCIIVYSILLALIKDNKIDADDDQRYYNDGITYMVKRVNRSIEQSSSTMMNGTMQMNATTTTTSTTTDIHISEKEIWKNPVNINTTYAKDHKVTLHPESLILIFLECRFYEGDMLMTKPPEKINYINEYLNVTKYPSLAVLRNWAINRVKDKMPLFQHKGRDYNIHFLREFAICPQDMQEHIVELGVELTLAAILPTIFFGRHVLIYYVCSRCPNKKVEPVPEEEPVDDDQNKSVFGEEEIEPQPPAGV